MSESLGRLERVNAIRSVWPGEASDFTPWLSRPENLTVLSEALGMGQDGLEFEASETNVGVFYADIVCRDTRTADGARVLIENQFGQSDHDHLGKLLTYASGLKARTVVLIGEKIREEHRATLDWLNDITSEDHNFFACEVELWRIGNSLPAPRFNVVVQPNDWAHDVQRNLPGSLEPTDLNLAYQRFWSTFNEVLSRRASTINQRKPAPQNFMDYSIGRTNALVRIELSTQRRRQRIALYVQGLLKETWFCELEAQKDTIEEDFGARLQWEPMPEKQSARIGIELADCDPANEVDWPRQQEWLATQLQTFLRVFRIPVKQLSQDGA